MYKYYKQKNLLSSTDIISKRIEKINSFNYKTNKSLIKTYIYKEKDIYLYKQKFFYKKRLPKRLKKRDFEDIAVSLDYFESINFVHGDINRKNIIYTNDGFKIVDYEPDLFQIKNKIKQVLITIPYTTKNELNTHKITFLTDKLGFIYFILRVQNIMPSKDVVMLSKDFKHEKYLNISYKEITDMSYIELIDIVNFKG